MARKEAWESEAASSTRHEGWSLTGPSRLVKVLPLVPAPQAGLSGYVCLEKVLLGKTPLDIETNLGLETGSLKSGCSVFRLTRLPHSWEVEYELTADRPDGLAYNPVMHDERYPPGNKTAHQWRLLSNVPVQHLIDLKPLDKYPYMHNS